jgi:hypothetical protein
MRGSYVTEFCASSILLGVCFTVQVPQSARFSRFSRAHQTRLLCSTRGEGVQGAYRSGVQLHRTLSQKPATVLGCKEISSIRTSLTTNLVGNRLFG